MNYNWKDLLILAGFQPNQNPDGNITLPHLSKENRIYLGNLFKQCDCQAQVSRSELFLPTNPPSFLDWFDAIRQHSGFGVENNEFTRISLKNIEFPMHSIVVQFNRLGLHTTGSCSGHQQSSHPRRSSLPYLVFDTFSNAMLANKILRSQFWCSKVNHRPKLTKNEGFNTLLEIGLFLSALKDLNHFRSTQENQREKRLYQLLEIPGSSGNEKQIGNYLLEILKSRLDRVWMNEEGNVLGELDNKKTRENYSTILLSAHQDVKNNSGTGGVIKREVNTISRDYGILGADDRAGIACHSYEYFGHNKKNRNWM